MKSARTNMKTTGIDKYPARCRKEPQRSASTIILMHVEFHVLPFLDPFSRGLCSSGHWVWEEYAVFLDRAGMKSRIARYAHLESAFEHMISMHCSSLSWRSGRSTSSRLAST